MILLDWFFIDRISLVEINFYIEPNGKRCPPVEGDGEAAAGADRMHSEFRERIELVEGQLQLIARGSCISNCLFFYCFDSNTIIVVNFLSTLYIFFTLLSSCCDCVSHF